jgi:diketogulonate reductase-like aldo/keto reductase
MEILGGVSQLNSGLQIPLIGFGTAALPQNKDDLSKAVATALKVGYRHFDTASIYGTEAALGEALNGAFQSRVVKRDEVFVTTKLYAGDHEDPVSALKTSLKELQLEYLDLYLIHWPINLKKGSSHPMPREEDFLPLDIKSIWRGLENCVELGLTKSIGVSNFSCKKTEDLLSYANIPPAVNQVEMHPMWQQKKLRDYCTKVNIHVSAHCPLGSFGTYYGSNAVMENTVIKEIAQSRGKTVAQVLLRWGLEQGVSVLPKSYNEGRLAENYQIFDWSLTRDDHEKIGKLEQKRIVRRDGLINPTTSPYRTIEDLWDGEI